MSIDFYPAHYIAENHIGIVAGGPTLNVSNRNAALIIERLGVEFDYCGSIDADDLLGRALVGNVGRDDSGDPAIEIAPNFIEGGLRAGYFDDRLGEIVEIATWAKANGAFVAWA